MTKSGGIPLPHSGSGHVCVAGAGIAGLTVALTLARSGFTVDLFEQAAELTEVGAGLQLSPNATRILAALGVLPRLMSTATVIQSIDLIDARNSRTLLALSTSEGVEATGFPFLAVHRADLQSALLTTAMETKSLKLFTNSHLVDAKQNGNGVTARFSIDGGKRSHDCSFLVGADGVWSQARQCVRGSYEPHFSGYNAFRATVDADQVTGSLQHLLTEKKVGVHLSDRAHLVAYPLRNGRRLNLVLVTRGSAQPDDWNGRGGQVDFRGAITGFDPSIRSQLESTTDWTCWPLYQCNLRGNWTDDRIALIGDAAHAMTPFAAQGACMAIEDAAVLAAQLRANPDKPMLAFKSYEALRRSRVAKVVSRGKFNRFAYHVSGSLALARNAVFKLRGQSLMRQLDWLYGFDALA